MSHPCSDGVPESWTRICVHLESLFSGLDLDSLTDDLDSDLRIYEIRLGSWMKFRTTFMCLGLGLESNSSRYSLDSWLNTDSSLVTRIQTLGTRDSELTVGDSTTTLHPFQTRTQLVPQTWIRATILFPPSLYFLLYTPWHCVSLSCQKVR